MKKEIRPQEGFQEAFLSSSADIVIGGGAAGVGKTFAELIEPLRHKDVRNFNTIVFRRTTVQIRNPGGLWDESTGIYPLFGAKSNSQQLEWTFPKSGVTLKFSHLEHEKNIYDHQGAQYCLIIFDELTHFSSKQFFYLLSRNRSMCGVKPYVRATCLTGETIISCMDGSLIPISTLKKENKALLSVSTKDGAMFGEVPTNFINKTSQSYRIITTHGEVTGTPEHILFRWCKTGMEEVNIKDINVGDFIASAKNMPHGERNVEIDLAYLVGYSAGDGGITGRKNIKRMLWTEPDEEHARYVANIAEKVCGVQVGIHKRSTSNAYSVYTTVSADSFVNCCRESLCAAKDRILPAWLTSGDEFAIKSALRGIFDAEGTVGEDRISVATISLPLMQQVSVLLRRFGIHARYDTYHPLKPRQTVYRLSLRGQHAAIFIDKIGFTVKSKSHKCEQLLDRINNVKRARCFSDADMVPIDRPTIKHLRRFFGKSWWNRNKSVRRDTLDKVILSALKEGENIDALREWSSFSWQKVLRIEDAGIREVYDVTMPTEHTYFAGCTLSHNCNPDPDSFVAELIEWWIDQDEKLPNGEQNPNYGLPIAERAGVIRYFIRDQENYIWGDTKQEVIDKAPHIFGKVGLVGINPDDLIKSITFIPGDIYQNKKLLEKNPEYLGNLMAQDEDEKARLLYGNWKIRVDQLCIFNAANVENMFANLYPSDTSRRYITCDAARFGDDLCTIWVWYGWKVVKLIVLTKSDAQETVDIIEEERKRYSIVKGNVIVDQDGVGGGVVRLGAYVGFSGGSPALEEPGTFIKENYYNLKTQLYYRYAEKVNNDEVSMVLSNTTVVVDGYYGVKIKLNGKMYDVRELIKQDHRAIKTKETKTEEGKKQINSKAEQKILLRGRSPDFSDGASLRAYFDLKGGAIHTVPAHKPSILDRIK